MKKIMILLAFLWLTACADNVLYRASSDYQDILQKADSLKIYPAKAKAFTVDITGKKTREYHYEYFMEDEIPVRIAKKLAEKGYRTQFIHKRDLKQKQAFRDFDMLFQAFLKEHRKLYANMDMNERKKALNIQTDLGRYVPILREKMKTDIIILSDYTEISQTSGARVLDALIGSDRPAELATLNLAILDLRNRKIIWTSDDSKPNHGLSAMLTAGDDKQYAREKIDFLLKWTLYDFMDKNLLNQKTESD